LESFFTAVRARTLLIAAENSRFSPAKEQAFMLPWIPQMQVLKMQGSHHLHLEDQAEEVAKAVQTFLG
jgi:pimeloyl-ACP methyl ester carboxylesterase